MEDDEVKGRHRVYHRILACMLKVRQGSRCIVLPDLLFDMRRFFALTAAGLLVLAAFAGPAEAQRRAVRPHYRAPPKPRAFTDRHGPRALRRRGAIRVNRSPRRVQPRFYDSNAAARVSQRLRARSRVRRVNTKPRRMQPRFYNPRSATVTIRRHNGRGTRAQRLRLRRVSPTFWK